MKASLSNYRQSPRKVRLITEAVKGKHVSEANVVLAYMPKRGAEPIQKLIMSAAANAVNLGATAENLFIKNIEVNKGFVIKRSMPRAMGVAKPINKRTSHVAVTLSEVVPKAKKVKSQSNTKAK
ncbi:MAG: rplV [Candidatus Nomurabacteria bacterium]|jgi:large subunit ribosomal protein L22|nr:rplV [Candidatus Nomurabacteria bacterium]